MSESIIFKEIGIIKTPFQELEGMPIQSVGAIGVKGQIILNEDLKDGLKDLDGFSHIILIYYLHKSSGYNLNVKPFLDNELRGLFATRAPKRPNPIGLSVVKLISIEDNVVNIENIDVLDGTPLLDIKPYVPSFDNLASDEINVGWLKNTKENVQIKKSDKRFLD